MPQTPPGKEAAGRKLGDLLRAARGNRTQQQIAATLGKSDATVSRFERGEHVPDLEQARRLDEVLGTGNLVRDAVRDILYNPARRVLAIPRKLSVIVYEPQYVGPVYVQIAAAADIVHDVRVLLSWGRKQRPSPNPVVDGDFAFLDPEGFRVDEAGIAFVFAKQGTDSTPLRVKTNEPLMLTHGFGLPLLDDERLLDANQGWLTL